ncbi:3-dehydrosphinganine reductase [Aspergillus clavatus NRRL 1]|uniref:3-dehydrosphinganine reductase n=1 Tax=Aspergillus clavatus (strain ATCC 1007 / CBS 513.65 / DSM 816 / NCTC 3887 / NRRL 1 / QM 1276 / 107) TaxID=344612 RepID=A1CQ04_ASPCL|nr:3-ketosphinganine reductase (Tsc10), putative [Aspergillus clavatus NRRL 1]EAW07725.1 3-ketosphinganine reductase (Tsc10), putative [Aspergillus clavatus NRRL 1]
MFGWGSSTNQFPVEGQTVLITGGSDGMGKAVACQLAEKGANVVIVARTVKNLQEAIEMIKAYAADLSKQRFHYISADLTDAAECERALAEVTEWNRGVPPDVVWCCAGYCTPGFFVDTPVDTLRSQMDTVYWTAANTAHATLKHWLKPVGPSEQVPLPRRHLIFTCSTLAFVPIAGYAPYSPAKAAIRSLSDTLSQEIEMYNGARSARSRTDAPPADVKIHTIFPMGILSPGFDKEQQIKPKLTRELEEADKPQSPVEVARISIQGLERGDYLITTMFVGHMMKGTALGASPRNSLIGDTLTSWASSLVFLHVIPDLRKKAFNWGFKNGVTKS